MAWVAGRLSAHIDACWEWIADRSVFSCRVHRLSSAPSDSRSDDNASVKPKMLYASSKDALKKGLTGINEEFQATERGDLDLEEIKKKAGSV